MTTKDAPTTYDYLIVGGGQVSDDAARAIRERDPKGSIGIISADSEGPYTRPALSKRLWTDDSFDESQVPLNTAEDTGADLLLGTAVTAIDRAAHTVATAPAADATSGDADAGGKDNATRTIGYRKLLLATGSTPKTLDGVDDERVIAFRTFDDYQRLRRLAHTEKRFVVVGGGYIGNELAAALAGEGVEQVQLVYPQDLLGGERFPASLARRYEQLFTDHGVQLVRGRRAERVDRADDGGFEVVLDNGEKLPADVVVVGLGAKPVLDLAEDAGLDVDDGVVVDEHLRTSDPDIWAAGDIANYPDKLLGRTRIEHVDNAREMGKAAGASMAGSDEPYTHTPYFYSQVFGKRWEAVGGTKSELETLQVPLDDDRLVVYYLKDDKPVGVLLWQVKDATDQARQVIADAPTDRDALRGRIG